jgi:CheY-specific phosphatase CheX
MTTTLDESLYQATVLTLEQLSYLLPMPAEESDGPREPAAVVASVEFHGPISGRLELVASQRLLEALAANMLGEDEGVSEVQRLDALMEAANVVCGNLLPALGGHEAVFQMRAPQIREAASAAGGSGPEPAGRALVDLDEGWAEVRVFVEGAVGGGTDCDGERR